MPKLERKGAAFYLGHKLEKICPDSVDIRKITTGELKTVPVSDVVLSVGLRPNNILASELQAFGMPVIAIGDAQRPGRIANAVHSAFGAAAEWAVG